MISRSSPRVGALPGEIERAEGGLDVRLAVAGLTDRVAHRLGHGALHGDERRNRSRSEQLGVARGLRPTEENNFSIETSDALVAFCHAVGFGFLLFQAVDAPLPGRLPWEDLISRLVAALGDRSADPPTTADPASPLDPINPTTMEIR